MGNRMEGIRFLESSPKSKQHTDNNKRKSKDGSMEVQSMVARGVRALILRMNKVEPPGAPECSLWYRLCW